MSSTVNYASTPIATSATLTTGDTSRTAPSTYGVIFDPGAAGGMCQRIKIARLATTTQTVVRIFRYDGSAWSLYHEVQIGPATLSNQQADPGIVLEAVDYPNLFPIMCAANQVLRATVNDTQTGLRVTGEGGGF